MTYINSLNSCPFHLPSLCYDATETVLLLFLLFFRWLPCYVSRPWSKSFTQIDPVRIMDNGGDRDDDDDNQCCTDGGHKCTKTATVQVSCVQ